MWSDSIFTGTPDLAKLNYLARVLQAVYYNPPSVIAGVAGSTVTQRTFPPLPRSFTWINDGELILAIEGSTNLAELVPQINGAINPQAVTGGYVNSYYQSIGQQIYNAAPAGVQLVVGHSRGGALSAFVARNFSSARSVSFGSPRYRSASLTGYFRPSVNIVAAYDLVPQFPSNGIGGVDWRMSGQSWELSGYSFTQIPDAPSTLSGLVTLAMAVQSYYHSISNYVRLTTTHIVPTVGIVGAGSMINIKVKGVMHGQAVENDLWYIDDAGTLEQCVNAFAEQWAASICPKVSDAYSVVRYEGSGDVSIWPTVPAAPTSAPQLRFGERFERAGTGSDQGDIAAGVAFPSFVGVGIKKVCGAWVNGPFFISTSEGGMRQPRGAMRTPPPAEAITGASGSNTIVAGDLTAWQNAVNPLRVIVAGGANMQMVVFRYNFLAGGFPSSGASGQSFRYARVSSLVCSPKLTSQVSRKERANPVGA